MRPLRLFVENLTAFRGEQPVLDLGDYNLFAIAGPTGSGKTSLLDAILIALYGKAPRTGSVKELISQGRDRLCIRLDFAIGNGVFRVTRVVYANTRPSQAFLERLVDGGEPVGLANGVTEVDAAIQRVVGLNYETFTQVVILPQGKFDLFLRSKPRDRNDILKELLRLQVYERMREKAELEAKANEAAVKMLAQTLEQAYSGVTPQALKEVTRDLDRVLKANGTLIPKMELAAKEAETLRTRVKQVRDLVDAGQVLADLDTRKKVVEQDEARLTRARGAEVVVPQLDAADRARREADEAERTATIAEDNARALEEANRAAKSDLTAATKAAARIPELDERIESLGRALALGGPIADARRRVEQATARRQKYEAERKKLTDDAAAAKRQLDQARDASKASNTAEKTARASWRLQSAPFKTRKLPDRTEFEQAP